MPIGSSRRASPLPGFGLSLGVTILWLSLIVLIPLSAVLLRGMSGGWEDFWSVRPLLARLPPTACRSGQQPSPQRRAGEFEVVIMIEGVTEEMMGRTES